LVGVNNLGLNLTTIQLIIPNKQGLKHQLNTVYIKLTVNMNATRISRNTAMSPSCFKLAIISMALSES
jgi:hypothetical protein